MKKPVHEYTDEEIEARLAFADTIMQSCEKAGKGRDLPEHLEAERRSLCAELVRRKEAFGGDQLYVHKEG